MHLHVLRAKGDNSAVTVDTTAELITARTMALSADDADAIATPMPRWLPAVSTSREEQDNPHGWYQQALTAERQTAAGIKVQQLAAENLSPEERRQTNAFTRHTLERSLDRIRPLSLPADTYSWMAPSWSAMVKQDARVVTHVGIVYRVIRVGSIRVAVGGIGGVMTLAEWRGRGYSRAALAAATAFVGAQLWAPFALTICPREDVGFYDHLGWSVAEAGIECEQPDGKVMLKDEVAVFLPCQGQAAWPTGTIDLLGLPW